MKVVRFPVFFECCGEQQLVLPDSIDADNEDAVKDYIEDHIWELSIPEDAEPVGNIEIDWDAPIKIVEYFRICEQS